MPRKKKEKALKISPREKYYLDILIDLIARMYGEKAKKVLLHIIRSGGIVAEETLGKDIGMKSNEARKILQQLADEAILRYKTGRVGDKTLHLWILNIDQIEGILIARLKKTREKLLIRLNYEKNNTFLKCPLCGRRYTFDEAFENDFLCPYDGEQLIEYDNSEEIRILEEKIKEITDELSKIGAA